MNHLLNDIADMKAELQAVEKKARKSQAQAAENGGGPDKSLRVLKRGNTWQYYIVSSPDEPNGSYAPVSQRPLVQAIAQYDYDTSVLKAIARWQRQLSRAEKILQTIPEDGIASLHQAGNLHPGRAALITPHALSGDELAAKWLLQPFVGKKFEKDEPYVVTNRGEKVRSKSEKIIADALAAHGIPYRYEAPLRLKRSLLIHPDFTVFNVAQRRPVYVEHLGMMDKPEYARGALAKMNWYVEAGYIPGETVFFTFEGWDQRISAASLNALISGVTK